MFYKKKPDFVMFLDLNFHFQRIFYTYYFIIFYKFNYTLLPSLKYKRKTSNFTKFEVNSTKIHLYFKSLRYNINPQYLFSPYYSLKNGFHIILRFLSFITHISLISPIIEISYFQQRLKISRIHTF